MQIFKHTLHIFFIKPYKGKLCEIYSICKSGDYSPICNLSLYLQLEPQLLVHLYLTLISHKIKNFRGPCGNQWYVLFFLLKKSLLKKSFNKKNVTNVNL